MNTRTFVINLKRRPDRIGHFLQQWKMAWGPDPIYPEVWPAVDGMKCPHPNRFKFGSGAWGCLQSHRQILEHCLMNNIEMVHIFEDDAVLPRGFWQKYVRFCKAVGDSFDGVYLGGQHLKDPEPHRPGVVKCVRTVRTHAMIWRGAGIRRAYEYLSGNFGHADNLYADIQPTMRVFAPSQFFVGQGGDKSDISGREDPVQYWNKSSGETPVILGDPDSKAGQLALALGATLVTYQDTPKSDFGFRCQHLRQVLLDANPENHLRVPFLSRQFVDLKVAKAALGNRVRNLPEGVSGNIEAFLESMGLSPGLRELEAAKPLCDELELLTR